MLCTKFNKHFYLAINVQTTKFRLHHHKINMRLIKKSINFIVLYCFLFYDFFSSFHLCTVYLHNNVIFYHTTSTLSSMKPVPPTLLCNISHLRCNSASYTPRNVPKPPYSFIAFIYSFFHKPPHKERYFSQSLLTPHLCCILETLQLQQYLGSTTIFSYTHAFATQHTKIMKVRAC